MMGKVEFVYIIWPIGAQSRFWVEECRVGYKSHQAQIKKLQTYLLDSKGQDDKGARIHKLLNEKENSTRLFKTELKIPATQLIQAYELVELEKEKEVLSNELIDCKANLIKFAGK